MADRYEDDDLGAYVENGRVVIVATEFQEKIRSIATPRKVGQSERQVVIDERDGSKAGEHIIHWDGRQDAIAHPREVTIVSEEGER